MSFKAKIQQLAFRNHMKIEKLGSNDELLNFISRFREHFISCDLIRVGGDGDGGYLHPPNLNKISYCFSPGVNDIADFEKHLSDEYGIKSFMADASVKEPPISDENFDFLPKFLGSRSEDGFITLSD